MIRKTRDDLLVKIEEELLNEIETFRSIRDGHCIYELSKRATKPTDNLLTAHIENLRNKILNLKQNAEYSFFTGHSKHAIYVNFLNNGRNLVVRVDNLGDGVTRHAYVDLREGPAFYPCLMNADAEHKLIREIQLDQYLRNLFKARYTDSTLGNQEANLKL